MERQRLPLCVRPCSAGTKARRSDYLHYSSSSSSSSSGSGSGSGISSSSSSCCCDDDWRWPCDDSRHGDDGLDALNADTARRRRQSADRQPPPHTHLFHLASDAVTIDADERCTNERTHLVARNAAAGEGWPPGSFGRILWPPLQPATMSFTRVCHSLRLCLSLCGCVWVLPAVRAIAGAAHPIDTGCCCCCRRRCYCEEAVPGAVYHTPVSGRRRRFPAAFRQRSPRTPLQGLTPRSG